MREKTDHWEYISTYVDDLAISSKDPQAIVDKLVKDYKFKIKGTGPISYHLGCDFMCNEDKVLCIQPKKYIEWMVQTYIRLFGEKPKELWAISIGSFDIATAIMYLSSFRVAPRIGHLEHCKHIYAYLNKMQHATIRVRTEEPDFSTLPDITSDWAQSVYGNVKEVIPEDCPRPLGKHVKLLHYVDVNLYHDMLTGCSVTGILHFVNKCPSIGIPRNRAQLRQRHLGLRQMQQELLRSRSSTGVAPSATWESH